MTEIFVKIPGVSGSGTGAHQAWLKVSSAQLSLTSPKSIVVTKGQDQASTKLFKLAMDGASLPALTIDFVKASRLVTRFELENVIIAEFSVAPGRPPMESMAFHYMTLTTVLGANPAGNPATAAAMAAAVPKVVRS